LTGLGIAGALTIGTAITGIQACSVAAPLTWTIAAEAAAHQLQRTAGFFTDADRSVDTAFAATALLGGGTALPPAHLTGRWATDILIARPGAGAGRTTPRTAVVGIDTTVAGRGALTGRTATSATEGLA
jgi:hypothetical protein